MPSLAFFTLIGVLITQIPATPKGPKHVTVNEHSEIFYCVSMESGGVTCRDALDVANFIRGTAHECE